MRKLRMNRVGGASRMRAEHLKLWLKRRTVLLLRLTRPGPATR